MYRRSYERHGVGWSMNHPSTRQEVKVEEENELLPEIMHLIKIRVNLLNIGNTLSVDGSNCRTLDMAVCQPALDRRGVATRSVKASHRREPPRLRIRQFGDVSSPDEPGRPSSRMPRKSSWPSERAARRTCAPERRWWRLPNRASIRLL